MPLEIVQAVDDAADGQAEEVIDPAHPAAVALGQIIVDGDDMDALAGDGVEVDRKCGDQRLAFTGPHLGDLGLVQDDAAHQLDVEVALPEDPLGRLAHGGEGVGQDVVQGLALFEALAQPVRTHAEFGVGQAGHRRLQGVDGLDLPLQRFYGAIIRGAEKFTGNSTEH